MIGLNKLITIIVSLMVGIVIGCVAQNFKMKNLELQHDCITMENRNGDYHWNKGGAL